MGGNYKITMTMIRRNEGWRRNWRGGRIKEEKDEETVKYDDDNYMNKQRTRM